MSRPRTAAPSLLALGAACLGTACGAPPSQPAQDTKAQDAATQAGESREPVEAPAPPATPDAPPASTTAEPSPPPSSPPATDQTPAPPPAPAPQSLPTRPQPPTQTEPPQAASLTVTMLSRGKGVPEPARTAFYDMRTLLEAQRKRSVVTDLRSQRIGLEGETRLCAEFRDARDAKAAYDQLLERARDIDLLDVAMAPCPSPKERKP